MAKKKKTAKKAEKPVVKNESLGESNLEGAEPGDKEVAIAKPKVEEAQSKPKVDEAEAPEDQVDADSGKDQSEPDPKVVELREKAIKFGMDEKVANSYDFVEQLLPVVELLESKAKKAKSEKEDDKKRVDSIIEKPNPREESKVSKQYNTKKEIMRQKLEKQKKVRFYYPLSGTERPGIVREITKRGKIEQIQVGGAVITVQLNGYKRIIPKGVFLDIPEQIAEVLSDSMMRTQQAGEHLLVDRVDDKPDAKGNIIGDRL